ncbi:hypothetical protein [Vibrio parahaemolyticus]|uniref:hypothetical protein n=1 Tax=Vibrio parahaemolyticus TaxID=670 RepID=UPI0004507C8E|nr:hypothetical protein [Vibrio parahaemolyticus]EVT83465.1 hypothetical protein D018_3657 [Vibrio parahaemolyticus VP2007-007]
MINPEQFSSARSMPTADIKAVASDNGDITLQHSYKLVNSPVDESDYVVPLRASIMLGWRSKLEKLTTKKFPWAEVLLAMASLGAGAIASSIISGVKLADNLGVLFYVVTPCITLGAIVAYFFVRHIEMVSSSTVAQAILDEMPLKNIEDMSNEPR